MPLVEKASGVFEEFDESKVVRALERSGASRKDALGIAAKVKSTARDGTKTSQIYGRAYALLNDLNSGAAARYGLKQAMFMLGPAGFAFEKYVGRVLSAHGYAVEMNPKLKGACALHEIDAVASKDGKKYLVECKFHKDPGVSTGLKEALYTWARLSDLADSGARFDSAWIVTNTRITPEAACYAKCKGMRVTGWGYPPGQGLQDMIDCQCIYPVTILRGLDSGPRSRLMAAGVVTVEDLKGLGRDGISELTGLRGGVLAGLLDELDGLTDKKYSDHGRF